MPPGLVLACECSSYSGLVKELDEATADVEAESFIPLRDLIAGAAKTISTTGGSRAKESKGGIKGEGKRGRGVGEGTRPEGERAGKNKGKKGWEESARKRTRKALLLIPL